MNMVKLPLITSDAIVANNFIYFNAADITSIEVLATTFVVKTSARTITMTFDGTNAAAKLTNVNKAADYFIPKLLPMGGGDVNRKQAMKTFGILLNMTIAEIHAALGLTAPGTNDAFVSIAIT